MPTARWPGVRPPPTCPNTVCRSTCGPRPPSTSVARARRCAPPCAWRPARRSAARSSDALPSAVALELLHTAFLVHDDVEDDSELRRGGPTLHRQYGRALAVNAGDGLAVLALGALRENQQRLGPDLAGRIWSEFDFMARLTVDGQARELGWQRAPPHRPDARRLPRPDHAQDLLVHDPAAAARRGADRRPRRGRPRAAAPVRLLPRCGVPDPRRRPQPDRLDGPLRQGAAGRPARGQADADADPPARRGGPRRPRVRGRLPGPGPGGPVRRRHGRRPAS